MFHLTVNIRTGEQRDVVELTPGSLYGQRVLVWRFSGDLLPVVVGRTIVYVAESSTPTGVYDEATCDLGEIPSHLFLFSRCNFILN